MCFLFCFIISDPENIKVSHTLKIRTGCFRNGSRWDLTCSALKLVCRTMTFVVCYMSRFLGLILRDVVFFFFFPQVKPKRLHFHTFSR